MPPLNDHTFILLVQPLSVPITPLVFPLHLWLSYVTPLVSRDRPLFIVHPFFLWQASCPSNDSHVPIHRLTVHNNAFRVLLQHLRVPRWAREWWGRGWGSSASTSHSPTHSTGRPPTITVRSWVGIWLHPVISSLSKHSFTKPSVGWTYSCETGIRGSPRAESLNPSSPLLD